MPLIAFLVLTSIARCQTDQTPPEDGPKKINVKSAVLIPDPIQPKDILAGHPTAATRALHTDADGKYAVGVWRCDPGTFRWTFGRDEFVYILEGEATVKYTTGRLVELHPGDAAYFPKGETTWTITKPLKKVFSMREP